MRSRYSTAGRTRASPGSGFPVASACYGCVELEPMVTPADYLALLPQLVPVAGGFLREPIPGGWQTAWVIREASAELKRLRKGHAPECRAGTFEVNGVLAICLMTWLLPPYWHLRVTWIDAQTIRGNAVPRGFGRAATPRGAFLRAATSSRSDVCVCGFPLDREPVAVLRV